MPDPISHAAAERAAAQATLQNGGFADRETYTAKQVAARCGTDPKTMRKFFRSKYSTVEPVGQGGRYEFDAAEMPKIKREFNSWLKRAAANSTARPKIHGPVAVHTQAEREDLKRQAAAMGDDEFSGTEVEAAVTAQLEQELAADLIFGEDPGDPTEEELEQIAEEEEGTS